jgi:hypothetical protein
LIYLDTSVDTFIRALEQSWDIMKHDVLFHHRLVCSLVPHRTVVSWVRVCPFVPHRTGCIIVFFGMILCVLVSVTIHFFSFFLQCQAQNPEGVSLKQDRRAVSATWVSSFALVVFVLLFLITGGVSASKLRSWSKYPDVNPLSIGKPSPRRSHTMVVGSDGSLWSFGGLTSGKSSSGELFRLDVKTKHWTMITTSGVSPSGRLSHTMTSTEGFLWVFGGQTCSPNMIQNCLSLDPSDRMWRLCLATLEWTRIEVPSDGSGPSGNYDRHGHVMVSIGLDLWIHGEVDGCVSCGVYTVNDWCDSCRYLVCTSAGALSV